MNALPKAFNDNPSEPSVFEKNGQVMTNSRDIAVYFGKRHDAVLRAIDNLDCSEDYYHHNFVEVTTEYTNGKGRLDLVRNSKGKKVVSIVPDKGE